VITPAVLDWLRGLQDDNLPDTCDISRYTETNTADGVTQGWATIAFGVPCRISSRTTAGSEAVGGAAQTRAVNDWLVWLPALTDVTVKDRLVVGARTFEVDRVVGESLETARSCSCSEVT
jgi:Phage head-tail joining protein